MTIVHPASRRRSFLLTALLRSPQALSGAIIMTALVAISLAAPRIQIHDPHMVRLADRLMPPTFRESGDALHPLGTDQLGRDVWARLVIGTRVSLLVGSAASFGAALIGVPMGLIGGYYRGRIGTVVVGMSDLQQSFPFFALAIVLVAILGPGLWNVVLVLSLTSWVTYARIVRADTLRLSASEFIEAARALGASNIRILVRHMLPNIVSPVLIVGSFVFSGAVISEASLTFLGLGVPPSIPTWGGMLSDARTYINIAWWIVTFPGVALMLTVLAINFLGDWLRETLDPRLTRQD